MDIRGFFNQSTTTVSTLLVGGLGAIGAIASPAIADAILLIDPDTLTTYAATAKTPVQDVRPLPIQRGTFIDGTLRAPSTFQLALAGNPFGDGWNSHRSMSGIDLATGTPNITDIDLALPAPGFSWIVGRSYNQRQKDSGGSYFASDGPQGMNWFQMSQPELVFHNPGGDANDVVYLVYGADRFIELHRLQTEGGESPAWSSTTFRAVNGAAGALVIAVNGDGPDLWTYYDQNGTQVVFFGIGDAHIDDANEGQLWKIVDGAGNVAHVGDSTGDDADATSALADGYDASGLILYAIDSADRRYDYDYSGSRLTQVKVQTYSGSWTDTGYEVDYAYYVNADDHGKDGDLKLVTITEPLTDTGILSVRKHGYWYYEDGTHDHHLKYVINPEGYRQHDRLDSTDDDDPVTLATTSEADIKPYADFYFDYDGDHRIDTVWTNGSCGCTGGGGTGQMTITRDTYAYTPTSGYDTGWAQRAVVELPNNLDLGVPTSITLYFDEVGGPLSQVIAEDGPGDTPRRATYALRDSIGCLIAIHAPANVTAYTHSSPPADPFTRSSTDGLVNHMERKSSGDAVGFLEDAKHQEGSGVSGDAFMDLKIAYDTSTATMTVGDYTLRRPLIDYQRVVHTEDITEGSLSSTHYHETDFAYVMHSSAGALMPKRITTTFPTVTTGENGSGSANTQIQYLRADGTAAFIKSPRSFYTYTGHTNGQVTKTIEDANLTITGDFAGADDPSNWSIASPPNAGLRWTTTYSYDSQGRSNEVVAPGGRKHKTYYSRLADWRLVTLNYADYDTVSTPTFFGPIGFTLSNLAGRPEAQATIAIAAAGITTSLTSHIDETDTNILDAIGIGTVTHLNTSVYDEVGMRIEESRVYFSVPSAGSFPGNSTSHFDPTTYVYDNNGRLGRIKDPTGTITRKKFNAFGDVFEEMIGTNDHGYWGGEASPTDNMVERASFDYDANGQQSGSTTQVGGFGATYGDIVNVIDYRGRVIVQRNPQAPHIVRRYDNLGNVTAEAAYGGSAGSLDETDDPLATSASDRRALVEVAYDPMGRVWRTRTHQIDQANGNKVDTLDALTWFDPDSNAIKHDGQMLTKTRFDRLGRQSHVFTLAVDDDTAATYSHVYDSSTGGVDIAGDIVLIENQTTYDAADGNVIMTATIEREHDDYDTGETTGALDTNADGDAMLYTAANLKGRIQITSQWFDRIDRVTDIVDYGTNGGSNFDRDPGGGLSVPARSDTELLTEYDYNTDGTLKDVIDPRGLTTRTEYDAAGRTTRTIANYDDGTPGGGTNDEKDQVTVYTYTDRLLTEMKADLPSGTDQVTTYSYGVIKTGTGASELAANNLLRSVVYPIGDGGSSTADREVLFAYTIIGQQKWMQNQLGTIIETDYDSAGRVVTREVDTVGSGVDNAVRRIAYAYEALGRTATVTQYDATTSGSVVDEVKFTYDGWGPISKFEQDRDSAVGAGTPNDYEISYTYSKVTSGRNHIARATMVMPSGGTLSYVRKAGNYDQHSGRVTGMTYSSVTLATYDYLGLDHIVGTTLDQPEVYSHRYTGSGYSELDRFDRPIYSRWTKDLATDKDFHHAFYGYDRNSNVTLLNENVYSTGKDVLYTNDNLNRLANAQWGTLSGLPLALSSETREQSWTLSQTGNWSRVKLDLNNDNAYGGAGEYDDSRTHTDVNELTARDTDSTPGTTGNNFTLDYDKAGRLTYEDEGAHQDFEYDAFGRLRKVRNALGGLIAEYRYNGLGHRIGWNYDYDADLTVESTEWFYFVYDEQWRIVAMYEHTDADPTEEFLYHAGGMADGGVSSSYIDDVVLRDRDTNGDGDLEERTYYCQNWHADVVALVSSSGTQVQQVRYDEYGLPFGMWAGDVDGDGDVDTTDTNQIQTWISAPTYDVRGDLDLDGDVDNTDKTTATANIGTNLGWGVLSASTATAHGGSRKGYAGYESDGKLDGSWGFHHVRNRVYSAKLGRWITRDPAGYRGSQSLYGYVRANPLAKLDPAGLADVAALRSSVNDLTPPGGNLSFGFCAARDPVQIHSAVGIDWSMGGKYLRGAAPTSRRYRPPGTPTPEEIDRRAERKNIERWDTWFPDCFDRFESCLSQCTLWHAQCLNGSTLTTRTTTNVITIGASAGAGYTASKCNVSPGKSTAIGVAVAVAIEGSKELATAGHSKHCGFNKELCGAHCQCHFYKCLGLVADEDFIHYYRGNNYSCGEHWRSTQPPLSPWPGGPDLF